MRYLLICWSVVFTCSVSLAVEKPNIVFILADDLGIHDLGLYGRKDHHTPNLDRLAEQGAWFRNAYASCPVCSPTRAAFMTGLAPARLHITTFLPGRTDCPSQKLLHPKIALGLPKAVTTLPEYLHNEGFITGCFGKWHLGGKGSQPADHGFDVYQSVKSNTVPSDTEGGKGEFGLTDLAIEFIRKNKEKPFFVYLAHHTPHIPYTAKPALVKANAAAHEPVYAAVIQSLDESVGKLLRNLDEWKLSDNTIVVFTSDNGGLHVPELQHKKITHNTPYRAGKGFMNEGGIRVPAIIRWPGTIPPGTVIDTPIITHDWLPTFVAITGGKLTDPVDGVNIAPLLTGKGSIAARDLYWHMPHYCNQGSRPSGAIREKNWKLIENYEDGSVELYDIPHDPSEMHNLAKDKPDLAKELVGKLHDWRKKVGAQENTLNPNFQPVLHKQLYIDVVPDRYNSSTATQAEFDRMQQWRVRMDAVVPKPKKKK